MGHILKTQHSANLLKAEEANHAAMENLPHPDTESMKCIRPEWKTYLTFVEKTH